jgi:hypothetical protein
MKIYCTMYDASVAVCEFGIFIVATPWLRRLVAILPTRWPGSDPRPGDGLWRIKITLGEVVLKQFGSRIFFPH